jgi:2-methylcitrate dehydratase
MSSPLAERIADYAVSLSYDQLDAETVHEVKRRLLDSLACALGAYEAAAAACARRVAARVRGEPGATLLGGAGPTSPELAAFVDGVLIRYLDYNDTYLSKEPAHPSDNFAAALAAAEFAGRSGRDLIAAAVVGYEIQCRLCDAASIRARGWDHVTYGAFSTAALSAKLLGLGVERTTHALNLAGTPNVALRQTRAGELSMWKGCAFANAARNGLFAALLAAEGMTGPAPIFEGEMGFEKQVSGPLDLPAWGGRDGAEFMIHKASIKYWPAEYHSQSAIQAALEIRPQLANLDDIAAIDIHTFDAAVDIIGKDTEKWRPRTRETADHSLPYCTAVALVDGEVGLAQFAPQRFSDPDLVALVAKVKVHRDAHLSRRYPVGIPNRVVVRQHDGVEFSAEVEFPRGHARNPMSDDEVEAKFRRLAEGRIVQQVQDRIIEAVWKLDKLERIGDLLALFPPAATGDN